MINTDRVTISREWTLAERASLSTVLNDESNRLLAKLAELRKEPAKEAVYSHTYIRWFQIVTFRGELRNANIRFLESNRNAFREFICA